jgi:hypothetical protein
LNQEPPILQEERISEYLRNRNCGLCHRKVGYPRSIRRKEYLAFKKESYSLFRYIDKKKHENEKMKK